MRSWLLLLLEDVLGTGMGPHTFCLYPELNCDGEAKGMGTMDLFGVYFSLGVHYHNPVLLQPQNKQLLQRCSITEHNQRYFCNPITIIFYCNIIATQ